MRVGLYALLNSVGFRFLQAQILLDLRAVSQIVVNRSVNVGKLERRELITDFFSGRPEFEVMNNGVDRNSRTGDPYRAVLPLSQGNVDGSLQRAHSAAIIHDKTRSTKTWAR